MNPARLQRLKARRRLWLRVHLYLGLVAGAVLAVVGLTGSIAVFYWELQEVLNAGQMQIEAPPEGQRYLYSLDEIVAAADTIKPEGSRFDKVYYPRNEHLAYKLLYYLPPPDVAKPDEEGDGYYIFVNPYTAQATGKQLWHPYQRYWGRPFVSFIMQLHWCLLLGRTGGTLVGILGVLAIISVLTGLIAWWPLTGKWRQALTFKPGAGAARRNYDLHKIAGVYLSAVLLVVLFSGVYFNLPDKVNTLVEPFSHLTRPNAWEGLSSQTFHSTARQGQKPIGPAAAEAAVNRRHPSGRFWMLTAPKDQDGIYYVWKRDVAELGPFIGYREFVIDQYSGELLKVYESGTGSAGDVLLDWQWPLHSGQAFGWPGRALVFLSGLAYSLLYVTGIIRWLQKRRAKKCWPVYKNRAGR